MDIKCQTLKFLFVVPDITLNFYTKIIPRVLTTNWSLGINIAYFLTYSHSNGTVTCLFTDTSNFNLTSTETTIDVPLMTTYLYTYMIMLTT